MKDGYYLSAYLHIDPLDHLLASVSRHDQNAALFRKSGRHLELVRYWELERFTGIKQHAVSFLSAEHARNALNSLLAPLQLTLDDMEEIWGTPLLETADDYHAMDDYPKLATHSIAHLFSALLTDSSKFYNETIIGLAVDGAPDAVLDKHARSKSYFSGCVSRKGQLEIFPVTSPGLLWHWATHTYRRQPGTLMALATASTSEAYLDPGPVLSIYSDSYDRNTDLFFEKLGEIDRYTEADAGVKFNGFDPRFSPEENKVSMAMKQVQRMSMRMMEGELEKIVSWFGLDREKTYLAMAGGYVLNCPTNSYLMRKFNFAGFLAPPCVNDSGMSLGIGLYGFYRKMSPEPLAFKLEHAYYGSPDEGDVRNILEQDRYRPFVKKVGAYSARQAVRDLEQEPVVWFQGRAEMGPRALGHRSLLGDPRSEASKNALNRIKRREWWRPVAPIVLEEHLHDWFEDAYPSPFMLHAFPVRPEKRDRIPAVAHLDGTARVQTVSKEETSPIADLLRQFYKETGIPIVCNTSLNDKGEPIVNSLEEAVIFALRRGIRVGYFNGIRVEFANHFEFPEQGPAARPLSMDVLSAEEREQVMRELNPHGIPEEILHHYKFVTERNPDHLYDLTDESDARMLIKDVRLFQRLYKHRPLDITPHGL
ncbi:carbamoyltransferase C-terminal domain-containing protein [Paenibacillus chitinolyticus]|uniref:carbamoyltransferase C-terminal domain-containing protein n=1 Tax=Paenibacillus chitinolyticus TaxID=79263 RepID=UPI0038638292